MEKETKKGLAYFPHRSLSSIVEPQFHSGPSTPFFQTIFADITLTSILLFNNFFHAFFPSLLGSQVGVRPLQ